MRIQLGFMLKVIYFVRLLPQMMISDTNRQHPVCTTQYFSTRGVSALLNTVGLAPKCLWIIYPKCCILFRAAKLLNHWGWVTSAPNHHLNQCWNIVYWTRSNKLQLPFNRKSPIFIQENTFENVVRIMAAILSRLQCVKSLWPRHIAAFSYDNTVGYWDEAVSIRIKFQNYDPINSQQCN